MLPYFIENCGDSKLRNFAQKLYLVWRGARHTGCHCICIFVNVQIISFEQKINLPRNFKLRSKFVEDFCYLLFFSCSSLHSINGYSCSWKEASNNYVVLIRVNVLSYRADRLIKLFPFL